MTHTYVISELIAFATRLRLPRQSLLKFVRTIEAEPSFDVIFVDRELHERAMILLESRLDKSWSLCDAVSFVLMQELGESEALTTDHHFEQAGFVRLLK